MTDRQLFRSSYLLWQISITAFATSTLARLLPLNVTENFLVATRAQRCRTDDLVPYILSLTFLLAVWTPKFWGWTSSSVVLSQVVLGRPTGLLLSVGGRSAAAMTR